MLDPKWIRENPDVIAEAGRLKRISVDMPAYLALDKKHRQILTEVESSRAYLKAESKKLGKLSPEDRELALGDQKERKLVLQKLEAEEQLLRKELHLLAMKLPMPPAPEVPEGKDDTQNIELSCVGTPPVFSFTPKTHIQIGEELDLLDIPRGVKLAGSRNYLLKGELALLEQAILRMAVDHMVKRGFELVSVPMLVNRECMEGTGYFPGGEEQAYLAERDDLSLIGTSEVPLTSIHAGEKLDEANLPIRRIALSPCFRREAGTYGKDTKGLYRVHQFWKVEQVVIGPHDLEWSLQEHRAILANATDFLDLLELPYRVVNVCGGDLGQGQVQKFDIETWMPSRNSYGETHSASRFHDFQARRLNLRYKPSSGGKPLYCHTLNNTVIASPRVLIALLENNQNEDGTVRIPSALQPFFGAKTLGKNIRA